MTFTLCIGSFIFRNSGVSRITNKRRGSSLESVEAVWPKPKKTRMLMNTKEAKAAEEKYLNSKITLDELQEIRKAHPPVEV